MVNIRAGWIAEMNSILAMETPCIIRWCRKYSQPFNHRWAVPRPCRHSDMTLLLWILKRQYMGNGTQIETRWAWHKSWNGSSKWTQPWHSRHMVLPLIVNKRCLPPRMAEFATIVNVWEWPENSIYSPYWNRFDNPNKTWYIVSSIKTWKRLPRSSPRAVHDGSLWETIITHRIWRACFWEQPTQLLGLPWAVIQSNSQSQQRA